MKAAIFGGSFDPPHKGHEQIIQKALQKLDIDTLFIVPTYLNPFKENFFAPPHLRYKWVKKLLRAYKNIKIIDYEMKKNRPVSTIETVEYINKLYHPQKLYLIIGADNLKSLKKWHKYKKLKNKVEFVIATREDIHIPKNLKKLKVNANISSTDLREKPDIKALPKSIANEILKYYKHKEQNERQNRNDSKTAR